MEETVVPGENHQHASSHWQTLSHNVVHLAMNGVKLTTLVEIGTDCTGSCKSTYYMITTTTILKYIHLCISINNEISIWMIYENIGMRSVIYIFNIMYNDYTMVIFYKNIFDVLLSSFILQVKML